MSRTVISVEKLCKAYRIDKFQEKADTMAGVVGQMLLAPVRNLTRLRNLRNASRDEETLFWALKDVDFEVDEGEVLGIIGHNGAGKSTLLKILSRITEPTSGRATIKGRVSSLLEVGTGFHPDLTGRENIFMNGTILGMRKREIDAKLDEIISFSGVSRHIDTPVKRYSSGMTVRLAFSVAAHLEPEILIIDEVLAVGDAEFQKKCLGKMREVGARGKTVLFVSHVLPAVGSLCTRALLIKNGQIDFNGSVSQAIGRYLGDSLLDKNWIYKSTGEDVLLRDATVEVNGLVTNVAHSGDSVKMAFVIEVLHTLNFPVSASLLLSVNGVLVTNLWTDYFEPFKLGKGQHKLSCVISRWPFREGLVNLGIYIHTSTLGQDWIENLGSIDTVDNSYFSLNGVINKNSRGLVFVDHVWHVES